LLLAISATILSTGVAFVTPFLVAQAPEAGRATPVSRQAIDAKVDVNAFFEKYERARLLENELNKDLAPFKEKARRLMAEIRPLEDKLCYHAELAWTDRHTIEESIKARKRALEDIQFEVTHRFGKRDDENIAAVFCDLDRSIEAAVKQHGFRAVAKFGPARKSIPENRNWMDLSDCQISPEIAGDLDVTDIVVNIANRELEKAN
jgi:hypothetical protein